MAAKTAKKAGANKGKNTGGKSNLAPAWKPGQSGNPSGRPRDVITSMLRDMIDVKRFVEAVLTLAYDGDVPAIKEVYRRMEGEPLQRILLVREQAMALGRERGWQEDDIKRFAARAEELAAGTG